MKTIYSACLSRLGLSQAEAAALHNVDISTLKHWSSGRRPTPPGVWDELREYEAQLVDRSEAMREVWPEGAGIEIDDSEADPLMLMAAADFVLNTEPGTPVCVGESEATRMARQARRPN